MQLVTPMGQNALRATIMRNIDSGLEEWLVFVSWNVLGNALPSALGMSHFPENLAAWRSNTLDSIERSVRIPCCIHRWLALQICVLGRNLAIFCKLLNQLTRSVELSFSMGKGDVV